MRNPHLSMLIPQAYELNWTVLHEGEVFNSYPLAELSKENPSAVTSATIAITSSINSALPVFVANRRRRLLVLQNSSKATGTDVAPTFWVNFGAQAIIGQSLALLPGGGAFLFDFACPIDSVFVTVGPSVNTGSSVIVQGSAMQGVIPPPDGWMR